VITNKNSSINIKDNLAFEVSGQKLLLAKGSVLLAHENKKGKNFQSAKEESISTTLGVGTRYAFSVQRGDVNVAATIDSYNDLSDCFIMQWTFKNTGTKSVPLNSISAPALELNSKWARDLWTMQGISTGWGQDFAFKLPAKLERENYLGHLQNGEGGGIPIVYFWNQSGGLSIAHIEPTQELWYMPVSVSRLGTRIAFEDRRTRALNPGDVFQSPR